MKNKFRIAPLLLSVLLLCGLRVSADAHEVPDENEKGTITVDMSYDGKAVKGGTLTACQVGQIYEDDGNYSFIPTPAMDGFQKDFEDLDDPKLAEDVAKFVTREKIPASKTANNVDGKAVFTEMELGLYLISQSKASDGYEPLKPFLIALPMNQDGQYVYEVIAEGKFQLQQKPPEPSDPTLPQTGQMNWPIPVLTVMGLGLFSAGWMLRFGRKKDSHEK